MHPNNLALTCIERGETAQLLASSSNGLAARAAAGERILEELGLLPSTPEAGRLAARRAGLVVIRSQGAHRAVLVLNGNTERFSAPTALLADTSTHLVLIKDPSHCFGLLGIPELGSDYDGCIGNLRRVLDALSADHVYCLGVSSGGVLAIRFGCDLGARGILGFSVPTTLDLRDDAGAGLDRYPQLTRLYRRARHLGVDLAASYAARAPRPAMMLVYSKGHARDAWLAGRMAGIAGVALVDTEDFGGHATYQWCLGRDLLVGLLDRLYALRPVGA